MPSTDKSTADTSDVEEDYVFRDSEVADHLKTRSASNQAGFLLTHLRSGMSLLDCGCGPGSITLDLAKAVSPGQVVGIDLDETQIELARTAALKQNVTNIRFETGSVNELPFPEGSFDVVFSNGVLGYLRDPLTAIKEMHRVLKSGGIIGIRNPDAGGQLIAPADPLLTQTSSYYWQLIEHNGGHRDVGRQQRALLHQAEFVNIQAGASCETYSTLDATRYFGGLFATFLQQDLGDQLIELGLTNRETLDQMAEAWQRWGEDPEAFYNDVWCEAVGWVV